MSHLNTSVSFVLRQKRKYRAKSYESDEADQAHQYLMLGRIARAIPRV
ncbi:MAG: hypothetical protein VW878_07115 [Candidatus Poseidoniales archaeon]